MKRIIIIQCLFTLLIFSACQSEVAKPKPISSPQKKAKFKREVFDEKKHPGLNAVGKVEIGLKFCSLTLVAEDIAVSAGHCFLESKIKFKLDKEIPSIYTNVYFQANDGKKIPDLKVERVLRWRFEPDYAIVKLNKKITEDQIKPLEISDLKYSELLADTDKLGCAAFNGDQELGERGKVLTISKNIEILYRTSNSKRFDTNCISTYGGSGGLFFEERYNNQLKRKEYLFLGVIWGVTGDNFDIKGKRISDADVTTSITPVKVFRDELKKIIENR